MSIGVFIGVTVGMVSMFLAVMLNSLRYQPFYGEGRWLICGGLAALGLILVARSVFSSPRSRPNLEEGEIASSPFLLSSVAYWGFLFLLFGGVVAIISPQTRMARAAETKPTNSITKPLVAMNPKFSILEKDPLPAHPTTNAAAATNAASQLAKLKLQGIVYNKVKPSAIINGRTYFVGDGVRDAKVVSIEPSEVVVELNGQNRTLRLGE